MAFKLYGTPLGEYLDAIYAGKMPYSIHDYIVERIMGRDPTDHAERMTALKSYIDKVREDRNDPDLNISGAYMLAAAEMLREGFYPTSDGYPWRA